MCFLKAESIEMPLAESCIFIEKKKHPKRWNFCHSSGAEIKMRQEKIKDVAGKRKEFPKIKRNFQQNKHIMPETVQIVSFHFQHPEHDVTSKFQIDFPPFFL